MSGLWVPCGAEPDGDHLPVSSSFFDLIRDALDTHQGAQEVAALTAEMLADICAAPCRLDDPGRTL